MKKGLYIVGVLVLLIVISFIFFSKYNDEKATDSNKVNVVTTLFPLYDFAKNIGKDNVEVTLLLPPGIEAHHYEPKPSEILLINNADVFVYTGKFMEPWAEDVIKGITNENIKIVDASVGINLLSSTSSDDEGDNDPHIWLDFQNAEAMVDSILNALTDADSENGDFYKSNAEKYKNQLSQLDKDYKSALLNCESKNVIYGGHYAFGYLTKRYDLKYSAMEGVSPDSEPTAKDLVRLAEKINSSNTKYIFYEELESPKIAETIASETNAKMILLSSGHNLSKSDFEKNVSFLDVMNENLVNLRLGLGCNES